MTAEPSLAKGRAGLLEHARAVTKGDRVKTINYCNGVWPSNSPLPSKISVLNCSFSCWTEIKLKLMN